MPRLILKDDDVHAAVKTKLGGGYHDIIDEIEKCAAKNTVCIVGMSQNPFCKKVRKNLTAAGVDFAYLEYGSYFKAWKLRLAIKMWSGWTTYPMVFVKGQLVGGNKEVEALISSGELKLLLGS